ncbi:MAG: ABC transporter substrate-binding protein [Chloroflexi bacterium]|nr:ABC transporter substrate-binding protein [Chloroflexota bacterium]
MVRRLTALFAVLLSLCLIVSTLIGCAESAETADLVVDDLGRPVHIDDSAESIVSLGPSITEILFALGLAERVVGVTDYCDYPAEAQTIAKVGAPFPGFSAETILDLEPDLVLSLAGTVVRQLENAGVKVVVLNPTDIHDIYRDIELVGQLTGTEKEAAALVDSMKERVAAVVARTGAAAAKPTVFYEVDASWNENKPWTAGYGTFQDSLINLAGGTSIAAGRSGWYEMSAEEILEADPEIIILEDYQFGVTPEAVAARSAWGELAAVTSGRVYAVEDPNLTCRPGPRIVDGLEMLARMIHPELFEA